MSHIEILVPFALPPAELAVDLLRELGLPALAMLLARARRLPTSADNSRDPDADTHDGFARSLPHEAWLAHRFGMATALPTCGSPPLAAARMRMLGMHPEPGYWFMLQPVHYHIARDHLVLTDLRQLALTDADARALFAAAVPAFDEAGLTLCYGTADCWFVRADRHRDLQTATPDATCGRNIDIWMPKGPAEREWRKLQNEIQMQWHASDVNQDREIAGKKPVNSLWLWGAATAPLAVQKSGYTDTFNLIDWMPDGGKNAGRRDRSATAADVLTAPSKRALLLVDTLVEPALGADMSEWLLRMNALEQCWFEPVLQALKTGALDQCRLILTNGTAIADVPISRSSLRKFWKKPSLSDLLE